jgi:hypothetical protein
VVALEAGAEGDREEAALAVGGRPARDGEERVPVASVHGDHPPGPLDDVERPLHARGAGHVDRPVEVADAVQQVRATTRGVRALQLIPASRVIKLTFDRLRPGSAGPVPRRGTAASRHVG